MGFSKEIPTVASTVKSKLELLNGVIDPLPLEQGSGQFDALGVSVVFYSGINGLAIAVRRVAGVIDKRAFLFARGTLFRRSFSLKLITTFITNPINHDASFYFSG